MLDTLSAAWDPTGQGLQEAHAGLGALAHMPLPFAHFALYSLTVINLS